MSKVFVTGANGFVGSAVCRHLAAAGWDVIGLVRPTSDLHLLDGAGIPLVKGDLSDPSSFRIPDGVTHIVHAASVVSDVADDETCRRNIFDLARNLVSAVRAAGSPLRRLVFVSTALTLGYCRSDISEDNPGLPVDSIPYTRFKILTESWLLDEQARRGLPVVILRPSDVMGPGDRTTSGRLFREAEKGMPLIIGRGRCRFGYTYIDNFCRVTEAALVREGIEGRAYTVSNGRLPTWREYLRIVAAGFGKKQKIYVPVWLLFVIARAMEFVHRIRPSYDPMLTVYRIRRATTETTYDISRTVADLGYLPDDDYIRQAGETLAWYKEEKAHGHIR
jgi:nucleoside-diphosphate-sugar epimerase